MRRAFLLFVALAFAGCASLGVDSAKGFQDQLAIAQIGNTSAVKSFGLIASLGKITKANAQKALADVAATQSALDSAVELSDVDLSAAGSKLLLVNAGLSALNSYLLQQQAASKDSKDTTTALMVVGLLQISTDAAAQTGALLAKAHGENRQVSKAEIQALQATFKSTYTTVKAQVDAMP